MDKKELKEFLEENDRILASYPKEEIERVREMFGSDECISRFILKPKLTVEFRDTDKITIEDFKNM